ncbi:hypothetical protein HRbin23_00990 [bacterium HR23]|nr:hypothetical protein HRbin23_00990 [bacterium HR23]
MGKRLFSFGQRLRPLGLWGVVVLGLTAGLVAYNAGIGVRWWSASRQVALLAPQVRQGMVVPPINSQGKEQSLAQRERQWDDTRRPFMLSTAEEIVGRIVEASQEAGIRLTAITLGDPQSKAVEGVRYQVQPVSLGVQGDEESLLAFLAILGERLPTSGAFTLSLADLAQSPSAQVQLQVYLSPQPVSAKGGQ